MTRSLIDVTGLVAGYRDPIIGPLSFSLHAGEVVGLGGANGSGKTTVLRALTGSARVMEGAISKRAGARLAYQAQQPPDVGELPLRGSELLALMHADASAVTPGRLQSLLKRRVDSLSGGERQLLLIWAAIAHPADILLLDEPTNNLDPDGVELVAHALNRTPPYRGVLVISHDQAFIERVAHRVVTIGKFG